MTDQKKPEILKGIKGMNDVFAPPESGRWEWLEGEMRSLLGAWGFSNIRTPIVEPTQLFVRGIGEVTDIVEKEMYSFEDKLNGDALTLRPEITAGIVRAVIEHSALYNGPLRVWSIGAVFRHERPQRAATGSSTSSMSSAWGWPARMSTPSSSCSSASSGSAWG